MKDVMIDFETFGNSKHACVVQIGACYFKRNGELGKELKLNVSAESAERSGAQIDAGTVYWWLSQSKEAISSITAPPREHIHNAFIVLNEFLSGAECIWSHATFDYVILEETMRRLSLNRSFSYGSARDIRTLMDLAGLNTKAYSREGVHHDALDDCKHQIKYCVDAMQRLGIK